MLFEHWNHIKKPSSRMIVPGKCQRLVEQKLAALKKAQALVLCARFESGSYLAISLEALAPDIFNIYEGRDASETSALQGAIREARASANRTRSPSPLPALRRHRRAHSLPTHPVGSQVPSQRVKKSIYRESTTNQQQLINDQGSSRSSCGTCLSSSSSCRLLSFFSCSCSFELFHLTHRLSF